jgi:hypothetical protein
MNLKKKIINAGQAVCWWARTKVSKEIPTQFLSRLRVHDPTAGVPEV